MNKDFLEIEVKYDAGDITIDQFRAVVQSNFRVVQNIVVSGYDDYFADGTGRYLRHRYNADRAELTVKRRLSLDSTTERVEVDVKIEPNQPQEAAKFASILGQEFDFQIYKTCLVWWVDDVNISLYLVYNPNMELRFRLVEIEANPDCLEATPAIIRAEQILGKYFPEIREELRLNVTMYEMFTTKGSK